jgi:hypothetical protein
LAWSSKLPRKTLTRLLIVSIAAGLVAAGLALGGSLALAHPERKNETWWRVRASPSRTEGCMR